MTRDKNTNFIITIETRGSTTTKPEKSRVYLYIALYAQFIYYASAIFDRKRRRIHQLHRARVVEQGIRGDGVYLYLDRDYYYDFWHSLGLGHNRGRALRRHDEIIANKTAYAGQCVAGEVLTICLVVFGFFAFNFVVTFLIGGVGWGLKGANMALSIFNSKTALILHPAAVVFFLHLFGFFQSIVFALISLTISTLFRSRSGATAVSILVYFVAFILDAFLSGFDWYKYVIFNNTNLFQYMSSTGPAIADLTLWFSLTVTLIYVAIMAIICFFTFAKRDAN